MAFLTESKLARYTERLWANITDKIDANKTPIDNALTSDEINEVCGQIIEDASEVKL